MERQRGGCCIARCAGGAYDMSKVDLIMLRYRPIAPKPASTDGSVSAAPDYSVVSVKSGRGKRRRNNNCQKRRKSSPENTESGGSVSVGDKDVRTLPLLPEEPDVKQIPTLNRTFPKWLSFGSDGGEMISPAEIVRRAVVWSSVRVECVTDTWRYGAGCFHAGVSLGRTDEERVAMLDADTCPGFLSDGLNRVRWTNAAYRRMVDRDEVEASVAVEEGVELPVGGCEGFTCRVRVVTCGGSKTVPCDVWRMDCGGFAWRLDTAAALSLGSWSLT